MFPNYYWILLISILVLSIFIDLGVSLRNSKKLSIANALSLSLLWMMLAVVIGSAIYFHAGLDITVEFITVYCVELSLSIDNIFVFIMIFEYFNIDLKYQHKVLFLGVLGAIIFRLIMITFGIYIIHMFEWLFVPFGILLIYSGYKLPLMGATNSTAIENNFLIKIAKKYFNYSEDMKDGSLFYRKNGKLFITSLTLALLIIEKADIIFALDSAPAVLAITKEPFIAFSSNILAVLGLRSMYFVIANAIQKFKYLKHGIGYMLIYIGIKMILGFFGIHFSNYVSILVILSFITCSITFSIIIENLKSKI